MKKIIKLSLIVCILCLMTGCGSKQYIDYGDAESFEAALNAGENLEGKIVRFKAHELHPDSLWGYNIWAGEHLNFVSSRNPDIKEGDEVIVKCTTIESAMGSWKISYEKVPDAVESDKTVHYSANNGVNGSGSNSSDDKGDTRTTTESTTKEEIKISTETKTEVKEEKPEIKYSSNQYYDVVEQGSYTTTYGGTTIIHKVLAKENVRIEASVIAYSSDGKVVGKSTCDAELTQGEYNYLKYFFDVDVSEATLDAKANIKESSILPGERKAVEMVDYNVSGDFLLVTFKQTGDKLGAFAKFKLLFYSGDQIVGDEDGYISTWAENLNGKDSTDVAKLLPYGGSFDRVEFFFEP